MQGQGPALRLERLHVRHEDAGSACACGFGQIAEAGFAGHLAGEIRTGRAGKEEEDASAGAGEAGELRPIVRPRWLSGSAKTGEGVDALLDALFGLLPAGPLLFDGDMLTDHPEKLAVADVIREKLFGLFRDELPHSIGVSVERVERRGDGSVAVSGTVYVRKANQKGIVLGEKGRTLRTAKRRAEAELRDYFGAPAVDCELWVRVEPDWDENFFLLRKLGYA